MLIQKQYTKINFTGNLDRGAGALMFFIIEETKETFSIPQKEL